VGLRWEVFFLNLLERTATFVREEKLTAEFA